VKIDEQKINSLGTVRIVELETVRIVGQTTNSLGTVIVRLNYRNSDNIRSFAKWCSEHECGKQVSRDQFAFNEEQLTMFMLHWS
jgi:hypothetical protein